MPDSLQSSIKNLLFEPIVASNYIKKYIFIFIVTYASILTLLFIHTTSPIVRPDTKSYFDTSIKNPWQEIYYKKPGRTPGMKMYATLIGVNIENIQYPNTKYFGKNIIDHELCKIVHANILLYSIALSFLVCTLCKIIPTIFTFIISFGCTITKIPNPEMILADPLAFISVVLFLNFCIEFYRKKSTILLCLICLTAVWGFLVKPACCFLNAIAAIICLLEILKNDRKLLLKSCIFIFLLLGTLSWPLWLYIKGGIFVVSQLSVRHSFTTVVHILQEGDEMLFKNDKEKKLVLCLIEKRKKIVQKNDPPTFNDYRKFRNRYYWNVILPSIDEIYGQTNLLEKMKIAKKVCPPIVKKHKKERVKHIVMSIKNSFTQNASYIAIFIHSDWNSRFLDQYWYIISFFFIFFGIITGYIHSNNYATNLSISTKLTSQIICICISIHILNILATSIGHFVLIRYSEITEWAFLLGIYLSLFNCSYFVIKKLQCLSPKISTNSV